MNGNRGELTQISGQAEVPVPLSPGLQVRQRADAGHVRDVHEVDEERARGADPLDRRRLRPIQATSGGKGGNGYVLGSGLTAAGILMPFAAGDR